MFIDSAEIYIKAGKGGDGVVSFRREKYVPKGGPDGGDGGNGGDIVVLVDNHCHGLSLFNRKKIFMAENGQNGMGQNKHGKRGEDLELSIPPGTQIIWNNKIIYDLTKEGEKFILAKGGQGGFGNQHFATSIKQAPHWSKQGLSGESKKLKLELKLIADVGLVGLPNSGKSTLLSVISNAKPKIANYPFTTIEPNLGVIKQLDQNVVVADIPGLIEGASHGRGLGDKFLKHLERTKIIVHVIDANSQNIDKDFLMIRKELKIFSTPLSKKEEIVVINKIDTLNQEELSKKISKIKKIKNPIMISAVSGKNIDMLINTIKKTVSS